MWYGVCERHPERKNTASPCRNIFHAMRLEGCKEFFVFAAVTSVIFCQNSTNLTYTPQILHFDVPSSKCCVARHTPKPAWCSALTPLHFDIPSSKCCVARHTAKPAWCSALTPLHFDVPSSKELTLGLPQINLGILSLNRSFVFWCSIIEMLRRSAYPQASLVFCAHSFAFLCFCVFVFLCFCENKCACL